MSLKRLLDPDGLTYQIINHSPAEHPISHETDLDAFPAYY